MTVKKRIALLLGQADEQYQRDFIEGFRRKAFEEKADVCIFSMYRKYQGTPAREIGDSNIFRLVNYSLFDGVAVLPDTIQTSGAADRIEEEIREKFTGPVVCAGLESRYFPTVRTDDYTGIRKIMKHLIEEHRYRDIAYLSGKRWHIHSKQRLQGFRDAMEEYGLPLKEDRIYYGDFSYDSGIACADLLRKDREHLPEAVVCANDCMAIGLIGELGRHGIRVPQDMAVTGFDGSVEGQRGQIPLTTVLQTSREQGETVLREILEMIGGKAVGNDCMVKPEIHLGKSCGCSGCKRLPGKEDRLNDTENARTEGFLSPYNEMQEDLQTQRTLADFINTVYSYVYQIKPFFSYDLCLNDQWKMPGSLSEGRLFQTGYGDSVIHAIHYGKDGNEGVVSLRDTFRTETLLPELEAAAEYPRTWIFTPVYSDAGCFGYSVLGIRDTDTPAGYGENYRLWCQAVCRGLEEIRRTEMVRLLRENSVQVMEGKNIGEDPDGSRTARIQKLSKSELEELYEVEHLLDHNLFDYYFQPIVNAKTGEIYSYEALMRPRADRKISPLQVLRYAELAGRLNDVEKTTFLNVMRCLDKQKEAIGERKIFINSIPGTKLEGEAAESVYGELKKHASALVVEFTEQAEIDENDLEQLKKRYREMGIQTAVDDYGTGYSNIANLLRYMPQYVKIDRSLLSGIQDNPQKQHFVREIIEFSHNNDIMALAEGVETTEEMRMVIHLGVDLIQGYYTSRPKAEIIQSIPEKQKNEILRYQQERQDGSEQRIYIAGRTPRVLLNSLVRDRFAAILAEGGEKTYRDVSIVGTPGQETEIHLEIKNGYSGRITLENVFFSNIKNRPCIDIGEDCEVTLVLMGENTLKGGGIRVPAGARLTLEGNDNLKIEVNNSDFYGIGNSREAECGRIEFYQDGCLHIRGNGQRGIGIGAGMGGNIHINRGKYVLDLGGNDVVGIGAFQSAVSLDIHDCEIEADMDVSNSVFFGSIDGEAQVRLRKVFVRLFAGASQMAVLGTLKGSSAYVRIHEASVRIDLRADRSTVVGALEGHTEFELEQAALRVEGCGSNALAFGGYNGDSDIRLLNADTYIHLRNSIGKDTMVSDDCIRIVSGRQQFEVNGIQISRMSEDESIG